MPATARIRSTAPYIQRRSGRLHAHGAATSQISRISPATGAITLWVPRAVFALLFGLSTDYEVFILTRINEEYEATGDTGRAVIRGIEHTRRLVTSGR
jgi:uncharacterized membrane protein YdfJ with MMPL/SSD domain